MPDEAFTDDREAQGWQTPVVLGLLILFFLYCDSVLNYMSMPVGDSYSGFHIFLVWIGMFVAQPALLAVWAVFGTEPRMVRLPKTLFLACLVSLALTYGTWLNKAGRLDASEYTSTLMPITQFLAAAIVLRLFRVFSCWRIIGPAYKDPANRAPAEIGSNTQFSLRQLLIWQSLIAMVVVAATMLYRGSDLEQGSAGFLLALRDSSLAGLVYGVFSLSIVFHVAIILRLRSQIKLVIAAIGTNFFLFGIILGLMKLAASNLESTDVLQLLTVLSSFQVAVAFSLFVVRLLGYRLTCPARPVESRLLAQPSTSRALLICAVILTLALATTPLAQQLHEERLIHHQALEKFYLGIGISTRGDGSAQVDFYPNKVVNDDAIEYVLDWPNLSCLRFTSTGIIDQQLKAVGRFKHLKTLFLDSTRITDEGLQHLVDLQSLTALYLTNSAVTAEGVKNLQAALPECVIIFEPNTP